MSLFITFLQSPWVALFLMVFLVLEGGFLFAIWRSSQRGMPPAQIVSFLGAGLGFAGALFVVLAELAPLLLAFSLLLAFMFHLLDIYYRWQR